MQSVPGGVSGPPAATASRGSREWACSPGSAARVGPVPSVRPVLPRLPVTTSSRSPPAPRPAARSGGVPGRGPVQRWLGAREGGAEFWSGTGDVDSDDPARADAAQGDLLADDHDDAGVAGDPLHGDRPGRWPRRRPGRAGAAELAGGPRSVGWARCAAARGSRGRRTSGSSPRSGRRPCGRRESPRLRRTGWPGGQRRPC